MTPTVRALELLEKLADERTKLIEDKLIQDQVIDRYRGLNSKNFWSIFVLIYLTFCITLVSSLRQRDKTEDDPEPKTTKDDNLKKFLEDTIKQKNEENIELTKKLAENQMNGVSQGDELERQRKVRNIQ